MYLNVESDGKIPSYDNMFKSFKINGIEYVGTSIDGYYNNLPVGECTAKIEWKDDYTGPFVNSFSNNQSLISLNKNFFKGIKPVGPLYWVFSYCRNLISLDLTELDVSNVNNMEGMFNYCTDLTSLDLSNWDTSKVTTMGYMFNNCEKLTSLASIKYWDTSNVTSMDYMFSGCRSLTSLDLSNWDTSNVSEMSFMFSNCQSLTEIRMGGDVSRIDINHGMFDNIASGGTFYYNSAYDYSRIIELLPSTWTAVSCELINGDLIPIIREMYLNVPSTGKINSYEHMFKSFKINDVEYVGTSVSGYYENLPEGKCTAMVEWIDGHNEPFIFSGNTYGNTDLIGLNKNFFKNIKPVGSLSKMFFRCYDLTSLDLSKWNTSEVTNMYGMFTGCRSLTSLDLTNWDTSNVTNMSYMFSDCTNLSEIRMGGDVSNVTNMSYMFSGIAYTGTFYYNSAYDYSKIITQLSSSWKKVACDLINGELVPLTKNFNLTFPVYLKTGDNGELGVSVYNFLINQYGSYSGFIEHLIYIDDELVEELSISNANFSMIDMLTINHSLIYLYNDGHIISLNQGGNSGGMGA